jgi:hypothetical protein
MRPPRVRRRRSKPPVVWLARMLAINVGALLVAALVIRAALALIGITDSVQFARLVRLFTDPIVWPLARVPGGSFHLIGALTPADISAVLLIVLLSMAAVGVVAGWEAEGRK